MASKLICLDNIEMEYVQFGNGSKTMVMIPGISLSPITLSDQTIEAAYKPYTNDYTVYVFDRKRNLEKGCTINDIANDYIKVFKTLQLKEIYLFGVSFGGMIAQLIAISEPELIHKLVLASTVSKYSRTLSNLNNWRLNANTEKINELTANMLDRIYSKVYISPYRDKLIQFYSNITQKELDHFVKQLDSIKTFNAYDHLEEIKCPVLVISSRNDQVLPFSQMKKMIDKLECESYIYKNGSHAIYDEDPFFKEILFNFYKD